MIGHQRVETMSVEQAAARLGIGRNTAYAAARRGEIPCVRIGTRVLVLADPFEKMLRGEWQPERQARAG